jgi:hypothetical protein
VKGSIASDVPPPSSGGETELAGGATVLQGLSSHPSEPFEGLKTFTLARPSQSHIQNIMTMDKIDIRGKIIEEHVHATCFQEASAAGKPQQGHPWWI